MEAVGPAGSASVATSASQEEQQHSEGRGDDVFRERGHVFYYPWYDNPEHNKDKAYLHWNHDVLANPYQQGSVNGNPYVPPEQIGANFYPQLGCYSSIDRAVIRQHMEMIRKAGLGVITVSWYPPAYSDGQIQSNPGFSDSTLTSLLDIAHEHGIKVNLHIEPYKDRSEKSVAGDIRYVIDKYGEHPAFYRHHRTKLPMFYVYDSYLTEYRKWAKVLGSPSEHPDSIRGTKYDAMVIALFVGAEDYQRIPQGRFDGVYTYFATNGFTHGSTTTNWARLASWAEQHGMIFIPSIGPGYEDTRIRPWNAKNSRSREEGKYYERMMSAAFNLDKVPEVISVTSWNEWHEGTQIEPAVAKVVKAVDGQWPEYAYMDYAPHEPDHYLSLTHQWMAKFATKWRSVRSV